ncbi:hypothetical protein CK203_096497 [Vitis vinifera]|uniref:Uncharacterized protein n=1 Tax=Vitis vinifera TaxID=29760 RepID=A0A438CTY5_VITVI|nr:hypothetical protein CK203_096497 [Vitis vinifera]
MGAWLQRIRWLRAGNAPTERGIWQPQRSTSNFSDLSSSASFFSAFYFFRKMEGPRPVWAVKVIMVIVIASIFFRCVSARNHTVGGPNGWDLASNLQVWSRSSTFYTGDNLGSCPWI